MKRILSIFLTVCMVLTLLPSGSMSYWCKHEYKADIHPAVCDHMGYTFYKCQLCGHEYYDDYVDAPGHPELVDGFCTQCNGYEAAVFNDGVYEIYNPGQLYWFAQQVNSVNMACNGKLMNDIVINENVLTRDGQLNGDGSNFREWTPIGYGPMEYFGSFDGNGKTISGLYCNITEENAGLFGWIGGGLVTNVGVVDSYVKGKHHVGAIAGKNHGVISNCYNTGVVYGSGSYVGGIVGENGFPDECAVINCYNTGNIYGHRYSIGGIVGYNSGGIVRQCYNTGNVITGKALGETESGEVGGIVGHMVHKEINGTITDCFNTGAIIGNSYVGGIIGHGRNYLDGHNGHSIASYCHNVGVVSAVDGTVGGIIGYVENVTVDNSYYLSDCTSENNGFGTAKTADEFASGELLPLLQADHDKQVWTQKIGTNTYPVFGSEQTNVYASVYGTVTSYLYAEDITLELLKDGVVIYRTVVNGTTADYRFDNVDVDQYILRISKGNHATQEIAACFDMNGRCLDVTIYPAGDVTGDGNVNLKDYQRLLRHVNKTAPLSDYALACGDVTGDGVCNIKDLQRMLHHVNKTNPLFE